MGTLAPGSAHTRPSAQPPIDTSEKLSAHVSGGGVKKFEQFSDQFSRNLQAILGTFRGFLREKNP